MEEEEIQALKKKLFSFGIFGTKVESFTEDELQILFTQNWTEIVYAEQIELLKKSFIQTSLADNKRDFLTNQIHYSLSEFFKGMIIRMNTIEWRNHLFSNFKFVNFKFYFILDALVKNKEIEIKETRKQFSIRPKMMFYMVKKLKRMNIVEEVKEGYIRLKLNKETKENKEFVVNFDKLFLLMNYPMEALIKKMIYEEKEGITSCDLSKITGLTRKHSLKLLTKFYEKNKNKIKRVEEFEGKVRRNKFYKITHFLESRNKAGLLMHKDRIINEDRLNAVYEMLKEENIFPLDKAHLNRLKEICKVNYNFDKRTILKIAKENGLKIIKRDSSSTVYYVAARNFQESEAEIKKQIKSVFSPFERVLYKYFVEKNETVGLETNKEKRIKLIYNFITEFMRKNEVTSVKFDMDLIGSLKLNEYFNLFGVKKEFKNKVIKYLKEKDDIKKIKEKYKIKLNKENFSNKEDESFADEYWDYDNSLKSVFFCETLNFDDDEIRNEFLERYKISKHKSILKEIKETNIFNIIEEEVEILQRTSINFDIFNFHDLDSLTYQEKIGFFEAIRKFEESNFYNECYSYISLEYKGKKFDLLKGRLDILKKTYPHIYKENALPILQFKIKNKLLLREIKKQIISNSEINLNELIKKNFYFSDIEAAISLLSEEKIIAGYKTISNLDSVHLNEALRKKLSLSYYSDFNLGSMPDYKTNTYYDYFFNYIYLFLITHGSCQKNTLLKKCEFFDEDELLEFLFNFSSFFRVTWYENNYSVELIN